MEGSAHLREHCSSRRAQFSFSTTLGRSHRPVTPVPGHLTSSFDLWKQLHSCEHTPAHTYKHANTQVHACTHTKTLKLFKKILYSENFYFDAAFHDIGNLTCLKVNFSFFHFRIFFHNHSLNPKHWIFPSFTSDHKIQITLFMDICCFLTRRTHQEFPWSSGCHAERKVTPFPSNPGPDLKPFTMLNLPLSNWLLTGRALQC